MFDTVQRVRFLLRSCSDFLFYFERSQLGLEILVSKLITRLKERKELSCVNLILIAKRLF